MSLSRNQRGTDRRTFLRTSGGALAGLGVVGFLAACGDDEESGGGGGGGGKTVFAQYGGAVQDARQAVYFTPFEKATGTKVVSPLGSSAKFVAQSKQSGKAQWDTIDAGGLTGITLADQGVLATLPGNAPNDLVDEKYQKYFAGGYSFSVVQAYKPETFKGSKPESWADFWDVDRFPGKRGWPKSTVDGTLEAALLADGVPPDQIYPIDIDRAVAKLQELRPHLSFYDSYDQGLQALQQGAVALLETTNGRAYGLQASGVPVTVVWNEAILYPWTAMPVLKNAPQLDATFDLIEWMADGKRQAEFAEKVRYGPNNSKAFEFMDDKLLSELPNSEENRKVAVVVDQQAAAKQQEEYYTATTEWQAEG